MRRKPCCDEPYAIIERRGLSLSPATNTFSFRSQACSI
jgi:hypothetical protein